ncbi:MAG: hypothetical protein GY803_10215, partial [Chloroflexi bacterium]|nr:hypothetical protein [Chloroflexota bacterium]
QLSATAPIGDITNTAVGTINEAETNLTNNQATFTTAVLEPAPQLTIEPANNDSNAAVLSVLQDTTASMIITATNTGTGPLLGGLSITQGNEQTDINYPWLEITPLTTSNIVVGGYVTFTVNITDNTLANGSYYDLIAIDSNDPSVASEPFFLKVYVHPTLVDFTVPVINTMGDPVPGALVDFTKTSPSDVYVDGNLYPGHHDTYFQQASAAAGDGVASMTQMESGSYNYEISAAGHQSVDGVITIPDNLVNGQFIPGPLLALPGLEFEPNQATLSVVAGESAYFTLQVRNHGPGHAENFTVTTPVDLPWISSGLPYGVTQLLAGETMSVTLFMNPPDSESAQEYLRYITVNADHVEPGYLAAAINVLDEPNGSLDFTVTGAAGAPVQDALVVVTNESGRVVDGPNGQGVVYDTKSATTDANGQVSLTELPPAEYSYQIDADNYYLETGSTEVWPGSAAQGKNDNQVNAQLTADPFSYEWTVEETTITDTYAITVEITYEADVVEPLLYVSHAQFCPGDDVQYLVANMGPVTMTDIVLMPNHEGVNFAVAPVTIGDLEPGQAYTGTFTTSGIAGEDAASSGAFNVTAVYQSQTGSMNYDASNKTTKHCPTSGSGGGSGSSGGWSWHWDNGRPVGSYTGKRPSFPGSESPPAPSPSGNEIARLILSGDAVLERQAFNARLQLDSLGGGIVEDITIDIEARDENGLAVVNGFAVTPTLPTLLGDLPDGGSLVGEWLIVPGGLDITDTNGAVYDIRAQIVYTWNGNVYTTTTVPQPITVYPQPYVRLNYSHTQPDENGDFYVEISARNDGYGAARNLVLDLSDVTVLDDLDGNGRSLLFELKETTMDGVPVGGGILEYAFRFEDIEPGQTKTGRWLIGVSASDGLPLTNQVVTGFKVSCEHLPYQGLTLSPLLNCGETVQPYLTHDCPFCGMGDTSATVGGPINTGNGNYAYQQSTPRINTVGNPLQFTWTYNSLNSGIDPDFPLLSSALGLGWTHNYQVALDLSQVNGPEHAAVVRAPHGTPMYFHVVRDGYEPAPGVHATMTSAEIAPNQTVYTVTTGSQATYVFTDTGQLLRQYDAKGNALEFSYNTLDQLERVEEPVSGRFLTFSYDGDGRLTTVTDPINRTTQFGYNALGHLTAVTDTRDLVWPYGYTQLPSGRYLLSRIEDPDGRLIEETGFDDYGRAITQTYMGQDLSIAHFADGRRLITDGLEQETIHIYNQQDLLVAAADTAEQLNSYVLDGYNNRTFVEDRNGNPTWYDKTPFGYTTAITDALGFATNLEYDAHNNWTRREDGRGEITLYDYDGNNLITETNHLSDTTTYTYNQWGQMTSVTDENDVATRYGFDEIGQLTAITNSLGLTTTYEYDGI